MAKTKTISRVAVRLGSDKHTLMECADRCFTCGEICMSYADDCRVRYDLPVFMECIRGCLKTGRLLLRASPADAVDIRRQLRRCAESCGMCAEELGTRATVDERRRACADECRRCRVSCNKLLAELNGEE